MVFGICSGSNLLFRGFFLFHFCSVLCLEEDKLYYRIAKCKGHEKRDRLLVSEVEFNFQIFQRNENYKY